MGIAFFIHLNPCATGLCRATPLLSFENGTILCRRLIRFGFFFRDCPVGAMFATLRH
jgi:hypothetical protein